MSVRWMGVVLCRLRMFPPCSWGLSKACITRTAPDAKRTRTRPPDASESERGPGMHAVDADTHPAQSVNQSVSQSLVKHSRQAAVQTNEASGQEGGPCVRVRELRVARGAHARRGAPPRGARPAPAPPRPRTENAQKSLGERALHSPAGTPCACAARGRCPAPMLKAAHCMHLFGRTCVCVADEVPARSQHREWSKSRATLPATSQSSSVAWME